MRSIHAGKVGLRNGGNSSIVTGRREKFAGRCTNIVIQRTGNLWKLGSLMVSRVTFVFTLSGRKEINRQSML